MVYSLSAAVVWFFAALDKRLGVAAHSGRAAERIYRNDNVPKRGDRRQHGVPQKLHIAPDRGKDIPKNRYLSAWDVHRAKVFGRCELKSGIASVDRLVSEVMGQEPYQSARRVFWIMDNGSAHRGQKAIKRFRDKWPNAILVHTPVHASWLNQIEIYFSIVQRKVLTPNDFSSLAELEQRLRAFQSHYERTASPFKWTFTRRDLHTLLAKIAAKQLALAA